MNVFDNFHECAKQQPEHQAIIASGGNIIYTYSQLLKEIEAKAELLSSSGIRTGHCIGVHIANSPDYIILTYAGWRLGACVVPVANEMTPEEKLILCKDIAVDAVITKDRESRIFDSIKDGEHLNLYNDINIIFIRKNREHPDGFLKINPAFLRFTSGTTGKAKGVVISHESINERIHAANRALNIGTADCVMWLLSMAYHFTVSIVSYLSFGATIVLPGGFMGEHIVRALQKMKCTIIYASPTHYQLMNNAVPAEVPHLRLAISTASSLSSKIGDKFYEMFHVPLSQAYGIIEVGLPFINLEGPKEKTGSVGKILPDYEVMLEESGMGDNLKTIKLKGSGFFDAYYEPWCIREDCMKDGWFDTGDFGTVDKDGYLFITGRSKEMINYAGMKFFPSEVEGVIERHPAVKEACVFPESKGQFEEIPYAYIVIKDNSNTPADKLEEELTRHCARYLSNYKIPEKFIFVDKIPRTASGKLIRRGQK